MAMTIAFALLCPAAPVHAQSAPPEEAEVAAPDANTGTSKPVFTVVIDAPGPISAFLRAHLALQRYRTLEDLDLTELQRLVAQVPADATGLLATLGYMTPQISVRLAETADATTSTSTTGPSTTAIPPGADGNPLPQVYISVQPGPPTLVQTVAVRLTGDIATRPEAAAQREAIQAAFSLKVGQPFTQAEWSGAKNQALRALTAQRYPTGRLRQSLAEIDPTTNQVALTLELDSGPALRLGEIVVTGTERYDPEMVKRLVRLAGLTPGTDYDLARVLEAQRRVAESGYFGSVFVLIEPGSDPDHAPVQVKVSEVLLKKLVLGVGGSTDNGARLSLEHTHNSLPGLHWRAASSVVLSRNNTSAQTTLTSPINSAGWRWQVSGLLNTQNDASGTTVSQRLRGGQMQDTTAFTRSLFLQYDRAHTYTDAQATESQASISINFAWTLRRLDQLVSPERGYSLGFELGSGLTLEQSRQPYLRGLTRGLAYLPFTDENQGRLALRSTLGSVWARSDVPVPSTELFLTGGDTTVRGYALRSLGVRQADGTVNPGRTLGTASVEWQRPLLLNGQRSAWENTFFIDAGNTSDTFGSLRPKVGVGTGVRYRSPVGPLEIDLAYGVATHRLRLHMTLGFKF